MRIHPKLTRGFTFLEIVCALAVLAIGILAVITLFPVGLANSKRAAERTRAALLAYQQLQRYRAMGFAYVTGALAANQGPEHEQIFTMGDNYYRNVVTIRDYARVTDGASPGTRIQEVTVTASWPSTQLDFNRRRQLRMSTLISEH